jgi:hypothetical protein
MYMKTFYESAEMEVVLFENEDIIATSNAGLGDIVETEDTFNGGALH